MASKKGDKRKTYKKARHVAANKRQKPVDDAFKLILLLMFVLLQLSVYVLNIVLFFH